MVRDDVLIVRAFPINEKDDIARKTNAVPLRRETAWIDSIAIDFT
jgi:hypothetical protein